MADNIIELDLQKSSSAFSFTHALRARRGDARSLTRTFQILNNGEPLDLTGLSVTFMAYNAGGRPVMESVQVQDATGQFEYTLPTAVVAVRGTVTMAYFRVEKADEWVASTDQIQIEVLDNVDLVDDVTGDYVPMLDQMVEASEELAINAGVITREATDAINTCGQAAETANSSAQAANEASVKALEAAETCDASREAIEANETMRQNNETSRKSYETQRRNAETAREEAESARELAEAKRVADFADMEQRSRGWLKYYCSEGEYDPDTRKPTIANPDSGTLYCTPVANPSENNHWTEWEWDYPNQEWELHGTTEDAVVAISTDEIDAVMTDEAPTGSKMLNLTGISYWWARLKAWATRAFAAASHSHPMTDLTGTLGVSKGGTGASTRAGAAESLIDGQAITPASVTATGAIQGSSVGDGGGTLAELRESVSRSEQSSLSGGCLYNAAALVRRGNVCMLRLNGVANLPPSSTTTLADLPEWARPPIDARFDRVSLDGRKFRFFAGAGGRVAVYNYQASTTTEANLSDTLTWAV